MPTRSIAIYQVLRHAARGLQLQRLTLCDPTLDELHVFSGQHRQPNAMRARQVSVRFVVSHQQCGDRPRSWLLMTRRAVLAQRGRGEARAFVTPIALEALHEVALSRNTACGCAVVALGERLIGHECAGQLALRDTDPATDQCASRTQQANCAWRQCHRPNTVL